MTTDERAKAVLVELDGIARDTDHYEYGLPLYTDGPIERMLGVVSQAVREAVAAERERTLALMDEMLRQYQSEAAREPAGLTELQSAAKAAAVGNLIRLVRGE